MYTSGLVKFGTLWFPAARLAGAEACEWLYIKWRLHVCHGAIILGFSGAHTAVDVDNISCLWFTSVPADSFAAHCSAGLERSTPAHVSRMDPTCCTSTVAGEHAEATNWLHTYLQSCHPGGKSISGRNQGLQAEKYDPTSNASQVPSTALCKKLMSLLQYSILNELHTHVCRSRAYKPDVGRHPMASSSTYM